MSCCGKKRVASSPRNPSSVSSGTPAGPAAREAVFEYRGGRVLTVVGQGTGYQYRFVGFGARAFVDTRDRASLGAVPNLREIRS